VIEVLALQAEGTRNWIGNAVLSAVIVGVSIVVGLILRWVIHRWVTSRAGKVEPDDLVARARLQRLETLARTLEAVAIVAMAVAVVLYLLVVWGIPIGPLVAIGSVFGIAIGFGAQDIVRDVLAGFMVLLEDQYSVGDVVDIAGASGTVEEIRLRTTVLRSLDGAVHHVPNGEVRVASNLTPDFGRMVIDIGITYDADIDTAIAAIGDEANKFRADPDWKAAHAGEPQMLGVNELGDSSVVIRTLFTTDPVQRWAIKREFLRRVKYRLEDEGIEIAYPHLQIIQRND
jgi:small conductance mechanosensitive channel